MPDWPNKTNSINTTFPGGYTIDQKLAFIRDQVITKFSLDSDSPCIDAGHVISGFHEATAGEENEYGIAWLGNNPDMGAVESDGEGGGESPEYVMGDAGIIT